MFNNVQQQSIMKTFNLVQVLVLVGALAACGPSKSEESRAQPGTISNPIPYENPDSLQWGNYYCIHYYVYYATKLGLVPIFDTGRPAGRPLSCPSH